MYTSKRGTEKKTSHSSIMAQIWLIFEVRHRDRRLSAMDLGISTSGAPVGSSWKQLHQVQGCRILFAIKNLVGLVLSCQVHGPQLVDDIIWILHWHLDTYFATFWTKLTHPLQVGGSWRHIPSRLEASLDLICVGNKFDPSQQHSLSKYHKSLTKRLVAKMSKLIGVLA